MSKIVPFPKAYHSSPWKMMLSNHISFPVCFSLYVSFSVWLVWNTSEIFIIWKYNIGFLFFFFFYSIKLRQLEVKFHCVEHSECDKSYPPFYAQSVFQISNYVPFLLNSLSPLAHWTWLLEGLCFKCLLSWQWYNTDCIGYYKMWYLANCILIVWRKVM